MTIGYAFPTTDEKFRFISRPDQWTGVDIPSWASSVGILLVGGGGPGGNGFTRTAGSAGGGGGGGGCGTATRIILPTIALPQTFYVFTGAGGRAAGTNGGTSVVTIDMANTANVGARIITAGGGGSGGTGTGAAAGTAGAAGAVFSATGGSHAQKGVWVSVAGQAGAAGGAQTGANGGSISHGASPGTFLSGGAGGGGTTSANFAGGGVTANLPIPGAVGGAAGTNDGEGGFWSLRPMFGVGGGGGGSNNTGAGGNGGNGAPGCGGGGGGAGTTGGLGGSGGDGFAFIWFM